MSEVQKYSKKFSRFSLEVEKGSNLKISISAPHFPYEIKLTRSFDCEGMMIESSESDCGQTWSVFAPDPSMDELEVEISHNEDHELLMAVVDMDKELKYLLCGCKNE